MVRTALYPGSFDPLTNGHVDVLRGAMSICDSLIVAIGVHTTKTPLLSVDDRLELIGAVCEPLAAAEGVEFQALTFDNLVVEFAREVSATMLIRGLRDGTDFDYEMQMAGMNAAMAPWLQTVFLPASADTRHVTATLVRQIAMMGGEVEAFVPDAVTQRLRDVLPD